MKRLYRKPYRIKRKKSIFKNRFFWLTIFILAALGGIFYLICFSYPFQIKEIRISGNQKVLTENLENVIQEKIIRNFIFFSTRSIFLVDFATLKSAALEKFPQIDQINFKRKFPQAIEITVKERSPVAVLYQEEKCFSLDEKGIIFEEASGEEGYPKINNLIINQPLNLGDKAVESELLSLILETGSRLEKDFKIPIKEFSIVSKENVHAKTIEDWEIYFNPEGDLEWQLTKLKADLEGGIPKEQRKDLEYIELRFENFAPYKLKD